MLHIVCYVLYLFVELERSSTSSNISSLDLLTSHTYSLTSSLCYVTELPLKPLLLLKRDKFAVLLQQKALVGL